MTLDEASKLVARVAEQAVRDGPVPLLDTFCGLGALCHKDKPPDISWAVGFYTGYALRGMVEREEIIL